MNESVTTFLIRLSEDEAFATLLSEAVGDLSEQAAIDAVTEFANVNGFAMSRGDVSALAAALNDAGAEMEGDLSDDDLDGIAGGGLSARLMQNPKAARLLKGALRPC